jgi:hypothetical protein
LLKDPDISLPPYKGRLVSLSGVRIGARVGTGVGVGVGVGEGVGNGVSVGFGVIVGEREGANVFVGSGTKDGTIVSEGLSVLLLSFPSGVSRAGVAVDSGVLVSVAAGLVETGVGSKVAMLLGTAGIFVIYIS